MSSCRQCQDAQLNEYGSLKTRDGITAVGSSPPPAVTDRFGDSAHLFPRDDFQGVYVYNPDS